MGYRDRSGAPRRHARAPHLLRALPLVLASATLAIVAGRPGPAAGQTSATLKEVPAAARGESDQHTGRARPVGVPREIGQLLEGTEAARQSGLESVRYMRHVGNVLYDWVDHLRIAITEGDRQGVEHDRANCQVLYELLEQSNPSAILGDDIHRLRGPAGGGAKGDPFAALLQMQLDFEKFRLLYPLHDLSGMLEGVAPLQHGGRPEELAAAFDTLLAAIAIPNLDGPVSRSLAAYEQALAAHAGGDDGEARRLLRNAANYVSHLNVGTYLAESSWFLGKAQDALEKSKGAIALAAVRDADTLLQNAEERAWLEFKPRVTAVRVDSQRLVKVWSYLSSKDLLDLTKRVDAELRIPS